MSKSKHKASYGEPVKAKLIEIAPKSDEQENLIDCINRNQITFAYGPPGCGKTMIATMMALNGFFSGKYDRIILTRPCVEAGGERIGFIPGTVLEKIMPYIYPIMDLMGDKLDQAYIEKLLSTKEILPIPFGFLRGLNFRRSFVIADEIQNTNIQQMRLVLGRLCEGSKMVLTGDLAQTDIRGVNGLEDAIERLQGVKNLAICELTKSSIVRSKIVADIEDRYNEDNYDENGNYNPKTTINSTEDLS